MLAVLPLVTVVADAAITLFKVTAMRGKPNRQFSVGGKVRHLRTGSTLLLSREEAQELEEYLAVHKIRGDYRVEPCRPVPRKPRPAKVEADEAKDGGKRRKSRGK